MTNLKCDPDLAASDEFNKVLIPVTINITLGMLHDAVTSAIEGSMTRQWAHIDVGKHAPGWKNYLTAKFVEFDERTGKTIKTHQLSVERLVEGLAVLAAKYPHHYADLIAGRGDAITGDVLVQCATIGDIKYG